MQEGRVYFSGKQKLHGVKVEESVLHDGIAIGWSKHHPRRVSYFEIIQISREWHKIKTIRNGEEIDYVDNDLLHEQYPNLW